MGWVIGLLGFGFFASWAFRTLELCGPSFASAECVYVFQNETCASFYVKKYEVRQEYIVTNYILEYLFVQRYITFTPIYILLVNLILRVKSCDSTQLEI